MRIRTLAVMAAAWLVCGLSIAAEPGTGDVAVPQADLALREQLQKRVEQIAADPERYREAMVEGELRATLCKVCHGADGNAVRDDTPNLAGQDPVYLVDQFNRYADGRREDFWMGSLTSSFSDEDKIQLALYYSEQPMRPAGGGDPALMAQGRQLYEAHCVECHGADGRSRDGYARLAGQRPEYTARMLREFRSATGRRYSPIMYPRAYMLKTKQDILAVATYLAHLE